MAKTEKNKNLFIITLDNGKQTYYDFSDNTFHGISGRVVKGFNKEAMIFLKTKKRSFLDAYFVEREASWSPYRNIKLWSPAMVETIYSLFSEQYSVSTLVTIAEFCYYYNYTLDKKGVKVLKEALQSLENKNGKINYLNYEKINWTVNNILYKDFPDFILKLFGKIPNKIEKIIIEDIKKIVFRYEHENWDSFSEYSCMSNFTGKCLADYIELCELLHKERTYKNLFLSICLMEKEKELIVNDQTINYQKSANLFFENDDFTVLIPTTAAEFIAEADYQHNCVFRTYFPYVQKSKTHIVFIRKKEDINTPYITCEINNNGKIIQYLTKYNKPITKNDDFNFLAEYQEFLHTNF